MPKTSLLNFYAVKLIPELAGVHCGSSGGGGGSSCCETEPWAAPSSPMTASGVCRRNQQHLHTTKVQRPRFIIIISSFIMITDNSALSSQWDDLSDVWSLDQEPPHLMCLHWCHWAAVFVFTVWKRCLEHRSYLLAVLCGSETDQSSMGGIVLHICVDMCEEWKDVSSFDGKENSQPTEFKDSENQSEKIMWNILMKFHCNSK